MPCEMVPTCSQTPLPQVQDGILRGMRVLD